jgi:hypothetical protein
MVSFLQGAQRINVKTMTSNENICDRSIRDERPTKRLAGLWTRAYSKAEQSESSIGFEWLNLTAERSE